MTFDINDKSNKPIVDAIQSSTALIIESDSNTRSTIRRLLIAMGAKLNNVEVAETSDEALKKLNALQPRFLFVGYHFEKFSGVDLVLLQKKANNYDPKSIAIILSDINTPQVILEVGSSEADTLIFKPTSYADLELKFLETLKKKMSPGPYEILVEKAKAWIAIGELEAASKVLDEARNLNPKPIAALYFLGLAKKMAGNLELAEKLFSVCLKLAPDHLKSLIGLFDIYLEGKKIKEAYEIGKELQKRHLFPPAKVPDFIGLALNQQKYDEVLELGNVFANSEPTDPKQKFPVAVGLFIAGKYYLRHKEFDIALNAFKKAENMSPNRAQIIKEIVCALYEADREADAEDFLKRGPEELRGSSEVMLRVIENLNSKGPSQDVLAMAMDLINRDVKEAHLFQIALELSKHFGRPPRVLEELLFKAIGNFPEKKEIFEKICK